MSALDKIVVTLTSGTVEMQQRWGSDEIIEADALSEVADVVRDVPELAAVIESRGVALFTDRYNGVYSGGACLAATYYHFYGDEFGGDFDDMSAVDYWRSPDSEVVGRGSTPIEAARDLCRRLTDLGIVA